MKPSIILTILAWLSLILVASCTVTDPRIGADSRTGYISEIYSPQKLRSDPPSCLASLTSDQIAAGKYVEVKVQHGRRNEYLSARVPSSIDAELHDEVEFSPKHCERGSVPEIKQILKRRS